MKKGSGVRLTIILLFNLLTISTFGQFIKRTPRPAVCDTPPAGYLIGGKLLVNPNLACGSATDAFARTNFENFRDPNVGFKLDNPVFYKKVDANFDINTAPKIPMTGDQLNENMDFGHGWLAVAGEKNGKKYFQCWEFEAVARLEPKATAAACTGNKVELTIQDDPNNLYDKYEVRWDGTSTETIDMVGKTLPIKLSHTYPAVPTEIEIKGKYVRAGAFASFCDSEVKKISTKGDSSPFLTFLEGMDGGRGAEIKFTNFVANKKYDVLAKVDNGNTGGTWNKLTEAVNGGVSLTGLSAANKYCFKLQSPNACGSQIESMNTICSINLKANLKSTTEADLVWNLPSEPNKIPQSLKLIQEVEGCSTCGNNIPLSSTTETKRNINTLLCSKIYTYQVTTKYPTVTVAGSPWSISIISAKVTVDPKSNAVSVKPSNIVQVDYDPNDETKVLLNILEASSSSSTANKEYTFFRSENGSPFTQIGTNTTNTFEDVALVLGENKSYCYKFQKKDECGVTSALSEQFCTILLDNKKVGVLDWTPYLIPPSVITKAQPVEYSVTYYDATFGAYITDLKTKDLKATIQHILNKATTDEVKFKIRASQNIEWPDFPNGQLIYSSSNVVSIKIPPSFFIPTAFTPNGDGSNETLEINSKFIDSGTIKVFDRWGGILFEGDLTQTWDGKNNKNGQDLPTGNYPYVINAVTVSGKAVKHQGSIMLMK